MCLFPKSGRWTRGILIRCSLTEVSKLSSGAEVNHQDDCGETPLHVAITAEQLEVVSVLIDAGAETSLKENEWISCDDLLVDDAFKLK